MKSTKFFSIWNCSRKLSILKWCLANNTQAPAPGIMAAKGITSYQEIQVVFYLRGGTPAVLWLCQHWVNPRLTQADSTSRNIWVLFGHLLQVAACSKPAEFTRPENMQLATSEQLQRWEAHSLLACSHAGICAEQSAAACTQPSSPTAGGNAWGRTHPTSIPVLWQAAAGAAGREGFALHYTSWQRAGWVTVETMCLHKLEESTACPLCSPWPSWRHYLQRNAPHLSCQLPPKWDA